MSNSLDRFNKFNPYVTINRDIIEAQNTQSSDIDHPYNLVEWITSTSETFGSPDDYIKNHTIYVKKWYKTKNNIKAVARTRVVNDYVKFLKEVLIVHNNQEEARYLMNIDWSDPYDMDIAVPYFANRLRAVVLYVVEQRDKVKFEKARNSHRGSIAGVTKYIYDQIIELLGSEKYYLKYGNKLPDIKQTAGSLTVTLAEKYDTSESVSRTSPADIDLHTYTDIDKVIVRILQEFPTVLTEADTELTEGNATLAPSTTPSPDDLSRLTSRYFSNYTNGKDTMNIHSHKLWLEKYSSSTMYYLSAGNSPDDYVFDKLYTANYGLYNHNNTELPGVVYDQPNKNNKTSQQLGGYFKNTGISHAYSLDLEYTINSENLSPGETQFFRHPSYYDANASGVKQYEDFSYIKADASNDLLHGDIIDAEQQQKFYPYQSMDESNRYPRFGVSKNTDNFDFWKGDKKDVWSNSDIYPVTLTYSYKEPTEQRLHDLLLGSKCVSDWRTDIFGNDYALLKESIRPKIHGDPQADPGSPCRVLDAEYFWNDTTWERPNYTDNVDGAPTFRCYDLKLYTDYAYGGYFSPYHCTEFTCFEPNHVEYPACPPPYVLSGHKATNDPEILEYWLEKFKGKGLEKSSSTSDLKVVFDTWNRSAGTAFYETGYFTGVMNKPAPNWYWDPILQSPVQPENDSFSAFLSPKDQWRTNYTHDAVVQSFNNDDDSIYLVAAYVYTRAISNDPDDQGTYNQIVAERSRGGMGPQRWSLQLRQGSAPTGPDLTPTDPGWVQDTGSGWNGGTIAIHVERDGNIIRAMTSQPGPNTATKMTDHTLDPTSLIEIDLTSDPAFADFLGPTGIGYACESQAESFFNDASAFKQASPPTPIEFDIYDFTQCKPKIWAYDLGQNIWNTYQSDDFDAKVAGDGVLVVDKDGCGSYGFDCLGRCLTVPATADCGPPPPPQPLTAHGISGFPGPTADPTCALTLAVRWYDFSANIAQTYVDYWDANGIDYTPTTGVHSSGAPLPGEKPAGVSVDTDMFLDETTFRKLLGQVLFCNGLGLGGANMATMVDPVSYEKYGGTFNYGDTSRWLRPYDLAGWGAGGPYAGYGKIISSPGSLPHLWPGAYGTGAGMGAIDSQHSHPDGMARNTPIIDSHPMGLTEPMGIVQDCAIVEFYREQNYVGLMGTIGSGHIWCRGGLQSKGAHLNTSHVPIDKLQEGQTSPPECFSPFWGPFGIFGRQLMASADPSSPLHKVWDSFVSVSTLHGLGIKLDDVGPVWKMSQFDTPISRTTAAGMFDPKFAAIRDLPEFRNDRVGFPYITPTTSNPFNYDILAYRAWRLYDLAKKWVQQETLLLPDPGTPFRSPLRSADGCAWIDTDALSFDPSTAKSIKLTKF
jgi:hypothetical protein